MATSSPVKIKGNVQVDGNARPSVRTARSLPSGEKRKPPIFVMMAGCDTCGQVHIIQFRNKREFLDAYCPNEQQPIYLSAKGKEKVWREFQNDLMAGAVAG